MDFEKDIRFYGTSENLLIIVTIRWISPGDYINKSIWYHQSKIHQIETI